MKLKTDPLHSKTTFLLVNWPGQSPVWKSSPNLTLNQVNGPIQLSPSAIISLEKFTLPPILDVMNCKKALENLWFQSTVMQYDAFLCEFQLVHLYHQIPYRTSKKLYVVFYHKKWSMIELVSHLSCRNGCNVTSKARVAIVKVSRGS